MTGTTIRPAAGAVTGTTIGAGKHLPPPSFVNSFRVAAVAERLASHVLRPQPASQNDVLEFFNLCITLARGIDYAVANDDVPTKAQDLPSLVKQVCQRKNDLSVQAAIMVLMLSVKNACKIGWFSDEESKEIFALANEIGSGFSGPGDANLGPSNLVSTISTIMARFYPQMKMGQILASLEVKPGYGAFMVDFHILKSRGCSKEIRLFVAQTGNTETSACIISPQQANFLINGKGVERRTNVLMDTGPQLPTNVAAMLKFGTNLLQVVGQFNGHYIVVVAFMSITPSLEIPVLQDYLQPDITIQDSDNDIIEGPSRISLNCPISYTRIRTPVKGHSCKHLQCFDFSNFVGINSRRPSWRCPHCNQHVCYTDMCVDQNMVKVLREVGENVTDVIISTDGSWSSVLESDDNVDTHNNTSSCNKERSEQQESIDCMNYDPVVLDLTMNDEEMDVASADEIEDTKPLLSNLQSQTVATNLIKPSESNNTVGVNHNVDIQLENNLRFAGLYSNGSASISGVSDAQNDGGISEPTFANQMTYPVLTDAISPTLDWGAEGFGYIDLTSVMQGQYAAPGNLQLQRSQFIDSAVNNEYGRLLSLNRHVNRTPMAVQALPAPSQTQSPQQRTGTSFNSLSPNDSTISSQAALSVASGYITDIEQQRQQLRLSRSHMNTFMRLDMASSTLQYHPAAQVGGLPASSTLPDTNQISSGLSTENQNLRQQQAVNLRMPQFRSQSPSSIQVSSPFSRSSIQQGGAKLGVSHAAAGMRSSQNARVMVGAQRAAGLATQMTRQAPTVPVQVPTSRTGSLYKVHADGVRVPGGELRVNIGGVQAVRADNMVDLLTSEKNWQPAGRMRGSLSGQAYSDALSQFMKSTQQAQPARAPQPNPTSLLPSVPPGLQTYLGNSRRAHVPLPLNIPNIELEPANMIEAQPARAQPNPTSLLPSVPPGMQAHFGNSKSSHVPHSA